MPDDPHEREAERIADEVMSAPTDRVMRNANSTASGLPRAVASLIPSGDGIPLDQATRAQLEPRFGTDFGTVRIHTGPTASRASDALAAQAFTVGRDITFAAGRYEPLTTPGRHLLAHELAHVVQQTQRSTVPQAQHTELEPPKPYPSDFCSGSCEPQRLRAGVKDREHDNPIEQVRAGNSGRPTAVSSTTVQRQAVRGQGPTIGQGPIGDIILHLPDWDFLPAHSLSRNLLNKAAETPLLAISIPDLGVRLDVLGEVESNATLNLGYEGALRDIQLGLSRGQFDELALVSLPFGIGSVTLPSQLPSFARLSSLLGEFRALAELDVSGWVGVTVHIGAGLNAVATAAGLFEVARLGAGFVANASADAKLRFRDRIGIYCDDGGFDFRDHKSLKLSFSLMFDLDAFLEAGLLGFTWRKPWNLAHADLARHWNIGADLDVDYHSDGIKVTTVHLAEDALAFIDIAKQLLGTAPGKAILTPNDPGHNPLSGSGGATSTSAGGKPPGGRTKDDPIPITWHKPPGLYPMSIMLSGERFFMTEPAWLPIPSDPGLTDIRRHADTDAQGNPAIRIGVTPGSRYYPRLGNVWPRVAAGTLRSGAKQKQFRRLLKAHGFDLGIYEADHVRDLQWAGDDAYNNLWPLARQHNNAANDVLNELVSYTDRAGVTHIDVPLRSTPLNLYFRINRYV